MTQSALLLENIILASQWRMEWSRSLRRLVRWKKDKTIVILRCLLTHCLSGLFPRQPDVILALSVYEDWNGHRRVKGEEWSLCKRRGKGWE